MKRRGTAKGVDFLESLEELKLAHGDAKIEIDDEVFLFSTKSVEQGEYKLSKNEFFDKIKAEAELSSRKRMTSQQSQIIILQALVELHGKRKSKYIKCKTRVTLIPVHEYLKRSELSCMFFDSHEFAAISKLVVKLSNICL